MVFKTVCIACSMLVVSNFVVKAQQPLYNTTYENGKVVSVTKYEMADNGLYEAKLKTNFSYNEAGEFLKKEVYAWNQTYAWNERGCRYPDYSKSNWTPQCRILYKKDMVNNFVSVELFRWDKKEKAFSENAAEREIFQLRDAEHFNYLAALKNNVYDETVNDIHYDINLLAQIAKK